MNYPFSEVLLREEVLITDETPHSTTGRSRPLDSGVLRKLRGSVVDFGGWPRPSSGALG